MGFVNCDTGKAVLRVLPLRQLGSNLRLEGGDSLVRIQPEYMEHA
jgi:hypothetical protein